MENRTFGKYFFGGLVILAGVLYLLFNIGALPITWKPIIFSWQALLVLIGCTRLVNGHYFWGLLISAIGIIYLLPELSVVMGFYYSKAMFDSLFWPIVIILFGVFIISHSLTHNKYQKRWKSCNYKYRYKYNSKTNEDGRIEYNSLMTGIDEIFLMPVFRGGEINAIMGGVKLDLRRTSLPEGDTVLELNSICGGIVLFVPEDWTVEIRTQSFLGNFSDKREAKVRSADRKLIIVADSIMGGGEIKC
ncbi:MAG: LiaF domain-containing protein [Bacteroidaceae bacterium]